MLRRRINEADTKFIKLSDAWSPVRVTLFYWPCSCDSCYFASSDPQGAADCTFNQNAPFLSPSTLRPPWLMKSVALTGLIAKH